MQPLSGAACEALQEAITKAFTCDQLQQLTKQKLNFDLATVVAAGPVGTVAFHLVGHCERIGRTEELVDALVKARPDRPDFQNLKARLGFAPSALSVLPVGRGLFQLPARLRD